MVAVLAQSHGERDEVGDRLGCAAGPRDWRGWRKSRGWISFRIRTRLPELGRELGVGPLDSRLRWTAGLVAKGQRWSLRVRYGEGMAPKCCPSKVGPRDPGTPGPRSSSALFALDFAMWMFCKRCRKLIPTPVDP